MRRVIIVLAVSVSAVGVLAQAGEPGTPTRPAHKPHGRVAALLYPGPHRRAPSLDRVAEADAQARVQPSSASWVNAMQVFGWSDGALYQVYAAPGEVTDIALEPGETLAGTGPVAAGDTVRWVIGNTESGAAAGRTVHILVKPTRPDLRTNLVINTDRRTYHVELHATDASYMASVSWRYPASELVAIRQSEPPELSAAAVVAGGWLDLDRLDFRYRIKGARPPWRPVQVFDDGKQTFVVFPTTVAEGEMPPLFVIGADGKSAELVNYRVEGRHMIVDRLFQAAELRMGDKATVERVRIEKAP